MAIEEHFFSLNLDGAYSELRDNNYLKARVFWTFLFIDMVTERELGTKLFKICIRAVP